MSSLRRRLVASCVAPFALALAGCGGSDTEDAATSHEPIAPIAAPAGQSWVDMAAETPEGGFRIGNPNAPIKLVEYASHTCSHCAEFSVTGAPALDAYVAKGTVSYEIRNLVRDSIDLTVAMLARCGPPEAFHPLANQWWGNFNQVMTTIQSAGPALQAASQQPPAVRMQAMAQASGMLDFFAARGISNDQALSCLADTAKAQAIADRSQKDSTDLNLPGTPTFFINGKQIEGTSWEVLEPALQAAGAR
jgi:protein-disulfide isomerase